MWNNFFSQLQVQLFGLVARLMMKTAEQGGDTVVYAALAPELSSQRSGGLYLENSHPARQCWGSGCFGPPGSGSVGQMSGSVSFPFLINVLSGLKQCLQKIILTQNFSQKLNFFYWRWCAFGQGVEKIWRKKWFFCFLKVNKERSRIRSWIRIH